MNKIKNFFLAIIMDGYAVIKLGDARKRKDIDNLCAICGYDRDFLDRRHKRGFNFHVKVCIFF
jgi:hypothetical protein